MTTIDQIPAILDELEAIYDSSVANLRAALNAYAREGVRPDRNARDVGAFAYPELRVAYEPEGPPPSSSRAFARLNQPGTYTSSIARPRLFRAYLAEQLDHLVRDYGVEISGGRSASEIPYPYVIDGGELELGGMSTAELSRWFPSTELVHIGDEIADGVLDQAPTGRARWRCSTDREPTSAWPGCATTPAPRPSISSSSCCSPTTFATSTSSSATRSMRCASQTAAFTGLSVPGAMLRPRRSRRCRSADRRRRWRRHQMPAYHLMADERRRHHFGQHRRRPVQRQDRSATISRCFAPRRG